MHKAGKIFLVLGLVLVGDIIFFAKKIPPAVEIVFGESASEIRLDAVVVLTGGQGRLKEALKLFLDRRGEFLFISGIEARASLSEILKQNQIEELPSNLKDKIVLDYTSRSTHQNAEEIASWVRLESISSFWLVSSNYHMPRSLRYLKKALERQGLSKVQIVEYPTKSPNFEEGKWIYSLTGWEIFLSEYIKARAYFFSSLL